MKLAFWEIIVSYTLHSFSSLKKKMQYVKYEPKISLELEMFSLLLPASG